MNNAIKFTPEGGTIHIVLTRDAEKISYTIADTGVEIALEDCGAVWRRSDAGKRDRERIGVYG